jgi:hypothetical protein
MRGWRVAALRPLRNASDGERLPTRPVWIAGPPGWLAQPSESGFWGINLAGLGTLSPERWLDAAGNYHSDQLHVVERRTRTSRDTLLYEAAIEDPKVFTRPWKIRMPLCLQKGIQILEDECEERKTVGAVTCLYSIKQGSNRAPTSPRAARSEANRRRAFSASIASGRLRRIDDRFVPVLFDHAVLDANEIEVIPVVFAAGVVGIFRRPVPHHEAVGAVDQR